MNWRNIFRFKKLKENDLYGLIISNEIARLKQKVDYSSEPPLRDINFEIYISGWEIISLITQEIIMGGK